MTETAKERIYREALDEINNLAIDVAMDFEETGIGSVDCGKIMDIVNKAFFAEANQQPSNTGSLSADMRVVQYARPLLQPLTPEQAVMDNLHEMTGKRFYRIYPSFCPMCGEKLEGSGDE